MSRRTKGFEATAGWRRLGAVLGLAAVLMCSPGNVAAGGFCMSSSQCDDGNLCTKNTCNGMLCSYTAKNCDDLNPCTIDSCAPATGACMNLDVVCPDLNLCSKGGCNPSTGECTYTQKACPNRHECERNGECNPGTGQCEYDDRICEDHNDCTQDSCDDAIGCINEEKICDDDDPCTSDSCNPSSGVCLFDEYDVCPTCGDPSRDGKVATTDALFILRSSVGIGECDPCLCDVNSNATISSSDALIVLRIAVDQPIVADCPPC